MTQPRRSNAIDHARLKVAVDVWPPNADDSDENCVAEVERVDGDEVRLGVLTAEGSLTIYMTCAAAAELGRQVAESAAEEWGR